MGSYAALLQAKVMTEYVMFMELVKFNKTHSKHQIH